MAVSFKAEHSRTSEYRFWPEDIVVKGELNGRHTLPDITDLIADIEANGQGVPVINSSAIRHAQGKNGDRAPSLSLKQQIRQVIESGKFYGIGGKQVEASDDLVEFLGRLIGKK